MAVLGYLQKLKRGLWLGFGLHFQHDPFLKIFLYHQLSGIQCDNFIPSQDIKQNMLWSSYFGQNFKLYLRSSSMAIADRENKRGRQKNFRFTVFKGYGNVTLRINGVISQIMSMLWTLVI